MGRSGCGDGRESSTARGAPCGPEIEKHDIFAKVLGKIQRAAAQQGRFKRRRGLSNQRMRAPLACDDNGDDQRARPENE